MFFLFILYNTERDDIPNELETMSDDESSTFSQSDSDLDENLPTDDEIILKIVPLFTLMCFVIP